VCLNLLQWLLWIRPHFVVLLKFDLDVQQTEAGLMNIEVRPKQHNTVTEFIAIIVLISVRPKAGAKNELFVQQTGLRGRFVEQKLMLSSNFRRHKIHKIHCYGFGYTLLCYLSQTWMFNELTSELSGRFVEQKLMLSSGFRCYQNHNCHRYDFGHTLFCYLSQTLMFNKPTSLKCDQSHRHQKWDFGHTLWSYLSLS
jgi:hypothetical protein